MMDGQTDGRTNTARCSVACPRLKIKYVKEKMMDGVKEEKKMRGKKKRESGI